MGWLDDVLEATSEQESPRSFVYWAALSALSGVAKNNVYLDKFYYKLYPNLYVMLIAKSGGRKGFPVKMAGQLVAAVGNTRVIGGRNSIQGVIKGLSTAYTRPDGGPPIVDASGFLYSGEFSNFIIEDPSSLTILTELYDGHYIPEWSNTLKGSGTETLKNVCLTMLGASNQSHLRDRIADKDITGGFLGRTVTIVDEKKHVINPLTEAPEKPYSLDGLVGYLKEVSKTKGIFTYSAEGKKIYEDWYFDFAAREHDDKTGASERIHDTILKVAMLLSLSRKLDLILEAEDIQQAIDACLMSTVSINKVTLGSGKSEVGPKIGIVLQELLAAPENKMSRTDLLKKHYGDFDAIDLDRVVDTLLQSDAITSKIENRKLYYILKEHVAKKYAMLKQRKAGNG